MTERILIIDDEESLRFTFQAFLEDAGYFVETEASFEGAEKRLAAETYDLIFLDIMLGRQSGIDLLRQIHERNVITPVVMITGAPEIDTATEAVRYGAYDYIAKPVFQKTLLRVTSMALRHKALLDQRERYRSHLEAIFRSTREGLLLVDRDLNLLECNASARRLLDLDDCQQNAAVQALPDTCNKALRTLVTQVLTSGKAADLPRFECEVDGDSGRVLKASAAPWTLADGDACGAVLIIYDETRLDRLERNLKKRQSFEHIIGRSPQIQDVFSLVESLAEVDTTVLITGESGTGKELVAEALHFKSSRKDGPLVKVNCAALPENLLESELFGHVKGSFTGALRDKAGKFQRADGGTIFLDEIGDISPATQVRLLRVLQNKEIEKVGGAQPFRVDVRIVAATNQNLQQKVRDGEFREDLYYRLRVVEVAVPSLRQRCEDIPLLVEHFIDYYNQRFNRQVCGVSDDAMHLLTSYAWPGNVRELQHAVERAFVISKNEQLGSADLPPEVQQGTDDDRADESSLSPEQIVDALKETGWNKSRAARRLEISRRTIYRKIEEFGIQLPEEFS